MNVINLRPNEFDDPVGQAIAALTSAADTLKNLALVPEHRERMANENDLEIVSHALVQTQLVAELIEVRMLANAEVA